MSDAPNILLITTDQLRWDALSFLSGWTDTPHCDQLAKEGVYFENAITTSPVCMPARFSLATGKYPHELGMWNNGNYRLTEDSVTWMQAVQAAGYHTACFGKTHFYPNAGNLYAQEPVLKALGFDTVNEIPGPRGLRNAQCYLTTHWNEQGIWEDFRTDYADRFANKEYLVRPSPLPLSDYYDVYIAKQMRNWLASYSQDKSWFCWLSFAGPHEPFDTPEPYASMIDPATMPPPRSMPRSEYCNRPTGQLDHLPEESHYHGNVNLEPHDLQLIRANYAAGVRLIDDQIGKVLETIQHRGDWENTIIVFSSDHGELAGDGGLLYKCCFLDGAVRVPLFITTPKSRRDGGAVSKTPVEWHDIGPTIVELAGGKLTDRTSARSLTNLLSDPHSHHRDYAFSEIDREIMLFSQRWKMALNKDGQPYLLIDRKNDPYETTNVVGYSEYASIESELLNQLNVHLNL